MKVAAGMSSQAKSLMKVSISGRRPRASRENVEGLRPSCRPSCRQLRPSASRRCSTVSKNVTSSNAIAMCCTLASPFCPCNIMRPMLVSNDRSRSKTEEVLMEIPIFINRAKYEAPQEAMSGREILALAGFGEDHDLFLLQGEGDPTGGTPLGLDQEVQVKPGQHF